MKTLCMFVIIAISYNCLALHVLNVNTNMQITSNSNFDRVIIEADRTLEIMSGVVFNVYNETENTDLAGKIVFSNNSILKVHNGASVSVYHTGANYGEIILGTAINGTAIIQNSGVISTEFLKK